MARRADEALCLLSPQSVAFSIPDRDAVLANSPSDEKLQSNTLEVRLTLQHGHHSAGRRYRAETTLAPPRRPGCNSRA